MDQLLSYEYSRMKKRHFWLIPSFIFFMFYPIVLPIFFKPLIGFLIPRLSYTLVISASTTIVHHTIYLSHCLIFFIISVMKIPELEQYRISKDSPTSILQKALKVELINFTIILPIVNHLFGYLGLIQPIINEDYPEVFEITWQFVFCMVMEDIWSSFGHNCMHSSYLYSRFHKQHHEYINTVTYASEYAHPVEFIFINIFAAGLGPVILFRNIHIVTVLVWISFRLGDSLDVHSGYEFPWSPHSFLPFSSDATFHSYHHTRNNGNYGSSFVVYDFLRGTVGKGFEKFY